MSATAKVISLDDHREAYRQRLLLGFWREQEQPPPPPDAQPDDPLEGAQWPAGSSRTLASAVGAIFLAFAGAGLLWIAGRWGR